MINGDRSTVRIVPFGPAPVRICNGKRSLEDNLECEMLMYRKDQKKPAEHNSKVEVKVYFSVDGETLHKIVATIDAKDYFGYVAIENFVAEIVKPTCYGIYGKIFEISGDKDLISGDKELAEYIICIDQSLI